MSDYIKREDAIKAMARGIGIPYTDFIDVAERCMDDIPTADVVEVVRCKDCKHFDKYIDCKEMYQWDGFCDDWARKTYENWYCSRAERRNDGGE